MPQESEAVIGAEWGDEGKGKIVDYLAENADVVARFSGGDNAGHSVTAGGRELKLHLIPSGVLHPNVISVIGSEVVVNPLTLIQEIEHLREQNVDIDPARFLVDRHATLIMPWHRMRDALQEAARSGKGGKIGTTGRGIGPSYSDRTARIGLTVNDLLAGDFEQRVIDELGRQEKIVRQMQGEPLVSEIIGQLHDAGDRGELLDILERSITKQPFDKEQILADLDRARSILSPFITNTVPFVRDTVMKNGRVLFEGAQGVLLDLTHGTLPFVTSSHPGVAGITVGFGIHRDQLKRVVGVIKAFQTRVGEGPMPTEQQEKIAERLRGTGANPWDEFGTTTGRPRRVGWLDGPLTRYGASIGGATSLAVTKLDILAGMGDIPFCVGYKVGGIVYKEPPTMDVHFLNDAEPIYELQPGWEMPQGGVKTPNDIPENARRYLERVEDFVGLPVTIASFGADREATILL